MLQDKLLSDHLRMLLESQHVNASLASEKHAAVRPVVLQTPVSWRSSFIPAVQYTSPASSGQTARPVIQPATARDNKCNTESCGALIAITIVLLHG